MISKISPFVAALFLIMIAPGIGFFIEGKITVTSSLCSLLAFFLIIVRFFEDQEKLNDDH